MPRASRFLVPLCIAALGAGCTGPDAVGQAGLEFKTGGGHVLDDRAWAVGSDISISVEGPMLGADMVAFEGDAVVARTDAGYGGVAVPSLFPGMSSYRYASGTVESPGDFDIVVSDGFSMESARVPARAEVIDDVALGVALDDCPEFADFVFDRDTTPALLEGSTIRLTPAPLDADGNPLVGTVNVEWDSDMDGLGDEWGFGAWGGQFLTVTVENDGFVEMSVDGITRSFEIVSASADELQDLQILAMPEKHGVDDASLLSVVGTTEDGRVVHGLTPTWSTGSTSQTVHADNGAPVEACLGGLCATWGGAN